MRRYYLRLSDVAARNVSSTTGPFTIEMPLSLWVTNPAAHARWQEGSAHVVTWRHTGPIATVNLQLWEGGTVVSAVLGLRCDAGSYQLTAPPSRPGSTYRVFISCNSTSAAGGGGGSTGGTCAGVEDFSEGFEVLSSAPALQFSSPSATSVWVAGAT